MGTNTFACALLAASLGTSAFASDQLGGSIGVDTAGLSVSELALLKTAIEDGDEARVAFVLSGGAANVPEVSSGQGRAQLAGQMGVAPDEYSLSELAAMMLDVDVPVAPSADPDIAGRTQLATSLGVDPAAYTTAELAAMKFDAE